MQTPRAPCSYEYRSCHGASTSQPSNQGLYAPWLSRRRTGRSKSVVLAHAVELPASARPKAQRYVSTNSPRATTSPRLTGKDTLPLFVALDKGVITPKNGLVHCEALRAGLKALRVLGVTGIVVDVWWGLVERGEPHKYNWSAYKQLLRMLRDMGFKIKVNMCFCGNDSVALPEWIMEAAASNPDLFYTDKAGHRSMECLTLGVNDVPVLNGRTAVQLYTGFMESFRDEFSDWLGSTITECVIGLGPDADLQYPSHPSDKIWTFPGVGEFQCYDKFMLATLKACAQQVNQPSWGLGGPHDAGSYCMWPHQTGFFSAHGNWNSAYGRFFLQWYSEMLARHACAVVGAASQVFEGTGVRLHVRIPGKHWWYNTPSHAAELTAGYYNTSVRDGYLPVFKALSVYGVGLNLSLAEMRSHEQPVQASCDPEKLLLQHRTVAAALHMPVVVENTTARFDEAALSKLESTLFEPSSSQGIEIPDVASLTFNRMTDDMFEPSNWLRFKSFIRKVCDHADGLAAQAPQSSIDQESTGKAKGKKMYA